MVREADTPVPGPVDLDAIVAASCAEADAEGGDSRVDVPRIVGRPFGLARRTLGRAAILAVDPGAIGEATTSARDMVTMVTRQLRPGSGEDTTEQADAGPAGSPLWVDRSRRRHLEAIRHPLRRGPAERHRARRVGQRHLHDRPDQRRRGPPRGAGRAVPPPSTAPSWSAPAATGTRAATPSPRSASRSRPVR